MDNEMRELANAIKEGYKTLLAGEEFDEKLANSLREKSKYLLNGCSKRDKEARKAVRELECLVDQLIAKGEQALTPEQRKEYEAKLSKGVYE